VAPDLSRKKTVENKQAHAVIRRQVAIQIAGQCVEVDVSCHGIPYLGPVPPQVAEQVPPVTGLVRDELTLYFLGEFVADKSIARILSAAALLL
jgi:hypothetical protein